MRRASWASTSRRSRSRHSSTARAMAAGVISWKTMRLTGHRRREHLGEVPRDRLALAVLVGGEVQLVGALQQLLEVGHHRLLRRGDHVERLEAVVDVDPEARPRLALVGGRDLVGPARQVADVADGRLDDEVGPEHAADGARLGRRLHDDERLTHGTPRGASVGAVGREGMVTSEWGSATPPVKGRVHDQGAGRAVRYAPEQVNRPTRRPPRRRASNRPRSASIASDPRLEKASAAEQDHQGDAGDGQAGARVVPQRDDRGQDEQRDQVHHLDHRVQRRAGRVLEGVADGVADDGGLVGLRALAALVAVLDVLLGVVPRATRVRQRVGHQLAGQDGRRPGRRRAPGS